MRGSPRTHRVRSPPHARATWDHGGVTNTPRTRVSDRFNAITPSATLAVDAKAKALKAAGRPVIGFGAGEPDFATPDYIVEAAVKAARNPAMHRYTPAAGSRRCARPSQKTTLRDSGYEVSPADIVVTNGGKQAVFQAFAALLGPATRRSCRPRTGPRTPRSSSSPVQPPSRCSQAPTRTTR